jgi:hypothetical protein
LESAVKHADWLVLDWLFDWSKEPPTASQPLAPRGPRPKAPIGQVLHQLDEQTLAVRQPNTPMDNTVGNER